MGRPPKPKGDVRQPGISARFNESEMETISKAVKTSGLGRSDWARKSLLYIAINGIRIT